MELIHIKRPSKELDVTQLHKLTKEELIDKIKSLHCHNTELKNIIAKSNSKKPLKKYSNQKAFDFSKCNYRHVLLKVMYLGWDYHGYASQEGSAATIEFYLFEALTKTCLIKNRESSNYHRCGRTDKGVSSFGQVISIDLRSKLAEDDDNLDDEISYCAILNKVLPSAIRCIAWCPVKEDFSARFDCKLRSYKYFFPKGQLNIDKMLDGAEYFLGTHDFRNFCKLDVGNGVLKYIRTVTNIEITPYNVNCKSEEYSIYMLTIQGQAFLWHQIRCIMGVLLLIGQEKEAPCIVKDLLDVELNSRKPDYNMASEVPLNLYDCEYDLESEWQYDQESLSDVIRKLQGIWTFQTIKSSMIEHMLHDLQSEHKIDEKFSFSMCLSNCLLNGVKAKKYIPLLQRQKCASLENRIEHYIKRRKLEKLCISSTDSND